MTSPIHAIKVAEGVVVACRRRNFPSLLLSLSVSLTLSLFLPSHALQGREICWRWDKRGLWVIYCRNLPVARQSCKQTYDFLVFGQRDVCMYTLRGSQHPSPGASDNSPLLPCGYQMPSQDSAEIGVCVCVLSCTFSAEAAVLALQPSGVSAAVCC